MYGRCAGTYLTICPAKSRDCQPGNDLVCSFGRGDDDMPNEANLHKLAINS